MTKILDRRSKREEAEPVYKENLLVFLYKKNILSKILLFLFARMAIFSRLYGVLQRTRYSRKKIKPFIKKFHLDDTEWEKSVKDFSSFEDFFTRKLKPGIRPIISQSNVAILPADGRYFVFPNLSERKEFCIKGCTFSLEAFLQDRDLAEKYQYGSMVIARLCPFDYHRFHFPFDCEGEVPSLINGYLYSVHPIALRENFRIFNENKRVITRLHSPLFQEVVWVEVGATNVGSIHQTFIPGKKYKKGDEKGYFAFGGSTIVLLFQPNTICFDDDLVASTKRGVEVRGLFGQSLGTKV